MSPSERYYTAYEAYLDQLAKQDEAKAAHEEAAYEDWISRGPDTQALEEAALAEHDAQEAADATP